MNNAEMYTILKNNVTYNVESQNIKKPKYDDRNHWFSTTGPILRITSSNKIRRDKFKDKTTYHTCWI